MSAGTLRISGRAAAPNMIRAAAEFGDEEALNKHVSSPLSTTLIDAADVIFVMSPHHADTCLEARPSCADKICMLSHWLPTPEEEIPDPMGQSYECYQQAARQLNQALTAWFEAWKA